MDFVMVEKLLDMELLRWFIKADIKRLFFLYFSSREIRVIQNFGIFPFVFLLEFLYRFSGGVVVFGSNNKYE